MQLTLEKIFGVGATQDSEVLIIQKTSLPHLTPSAANTAESLLVAILIKALANFEGILEDPAGLAVTDPDGLPIDTPISGVNEAIELSRWKRFYNVPFRGKAIIRDCILIEIGIGPLTSNVPLLEF